MLSSAASFSSAQDQLVYFGTHSAGAGLGISVAHFNSQTGVLTYPELVCEAESPAYFIIHPDGKHLYTCNSNDFSKGFTGRTISAYAIEKPTGKLTFLNRQSSGGDDPSFVYGDATRKYLLTANYVGGGVGVLQLNSDGSLGPVSARITHTGKSIDTIRQTKPYAHSIKTDPTNKFALAADLGLDKLFIYRFHEEDGTLTPNTIPFVQCPAGSGPRHFTFSRDGRYLYLLTEMGSTLLTFAWDPEHGNLTHQQTISTLPSGFTGVNTCAEIDVHPNGKFLYATNRGHDSIVLCAVDSLTGLLSVVEHYSTQGHKPRNFAFDPTGQWIIVTNHASDNAVVFHVDGISGRLMQHGAPVHVPSPFCVRFLSLN